MLSLEQLLQEVEIARTAFIAEASGLSLAQAEFKPNPDSWNTIEIVEHITRAEQSGLAYLWKAFDAIQHGEPVWSGELPHEGLSVEEIVARTWQEKEKVPPIAAPQWGGSLNYWLALLQAQRYLLAAFGTALASHELEKIVYPHLISGPMDARQRLAFLRFHLERHQEQIKKVKAFAGFPV
jgi:hypothetical protein